jgi:hypothetical protein
VAAVIFTPATAGGGADADVDVDVDVDVGACVVAVVLADELADVELVDEPELPQPAIATRTIARVTKLDVLLSMPVPEPSPHNDTPIGGPPPRIGRCRSGSPGSRRRGF